jgi:hypothetical protein
LVDLAVPISVEFSANTNRITHEETVRVNNLSQFLLKLY